MPYTPQRCDPGTANPTIAPYAPAWSFLSTFAALACAVISLQAAGKEVAEPNYGSSGIDLRARDLTVKPGDDFNTYASGAWQKRTVIPADQTDAGVFVEVENRTQARVRKIIQESAAKPATATARKIGDLYSAFMDEKRIETLGARPVAEDLRVIRDATDKAAVAFLMGRAQVNYGKGFFWAERKVDANHPASQVLRLHQGGLGMRDREIYVNDNFAKLRTAYRDYAASTLKLIGWPEANKRADEILAVEMRVAEASWPTSDTNDRAKTFSPATRVELEALAPSFPWRDYLRGAGVEGLDHFVLGEKTAFPKIAAIFDETPLETLRAWEAFQTVDEAAPYLAKKFVENRLAFRGKAEQGLSEDQPRWKRGVTLVNDSLGEAVGSEYVARHFPASEKAQIEELVVNLKTAMFARLERLDWMGPETKAAATRKLQRMRVMVGYPDEWRDYSDVVIKRDDLYGSVRNAKAFNWKYETSKLAEPTNPDEWLMSPQKIDAYSDFGRVAVVFPAGILQPPFFNPSADPAANYGATGAVIGHEIIHQFDSQGRKLDETGALRDWWTAEDGTRFEEKAAKLATQFEVIEPYPGLHLNGRLTLGENMADLAGLVMAVDAYHASLKGEPAPVIDGLTGDQRLFLGFAQSWRTKTREEVDRQSVAADIHPPPRYRLIGSTRNVDSWYEAFDVKPGTRYYLAPEERVRIW